MEYTSQLENNNLKLFLQGSLDSSNAADFEAKVIPLFNGVKSAILDFKKVEYVSSAGLRVILKMKKLVSDLQIVNVSTTVYEVFEMTGFSELIEIKKARRQLSVEGCAVVGQGATGTVYRLSEDTIVKVYRPNITIEAIDRERSLARKAFVLGVPTAIPYDVVDVGDQLGTVFEMLNAKTLATLMKEDHDNLQKYIDMLIDVMQIIHGAKLKPGELIDKKAEVIEWAHNIESLLDEFTSNKLNNLLANVKDDSLMLHGDYHIKNVMVMNGEPFIIDMDTLATGHRIFEYGFMYSCYKAYSEIDLENSSRFFNISSEDIDEIFKKSIMVAEKIETEEQYIKVLNKARIVSYVQLIDRFDRADEKQEEKELFIKELTELVNIVDDLNL